MGTRRSSSTFARTAVTLGVVASSLGAATAATAETVRLDERVTSRASCIDRSALVRSIAARRGADEIDRRLSVDVLTDPESAEHVVFRFARDGNPVGERRIGPIACNAMTEASALAIALALDTLLVEDATPAQEEDATPLQRPAPTSRPAVTTDSTLEAKPVHRTALGMGARTNGIVGVLPVVALGGSMGVESWLTPRFDARLSVMGSVPSDVPIGSSRAEVTWLAGRLDACYVALPTIAHLRLCGGAAAGVFIAHGVAFLASHATERPWLAAVAGVDMRVKLVGAFGLSGGIDAFAPLLRPRLEVISLDGTVRDTRRPSLVGVAVGFGPHVIF